jgi:hypothetical protein
MNNTQNQWDIKFRREATFMPYGSLMNAWALLNQGKDIPLEEFLKQSELIFDLAVRLVEKRAKEVQELPTPTEEPEF